MLSTSAGLSSRSASRYRSAMRSFSTRPVNVTASAMPRSAHKAFEIDALRARAGNRELRVRMRSMQASERTQGGRHVVDVFQVPGDEHVQPARRGSEGRKRSRSTMFGTISVCTRCLPEHVEEPATARSRTGAAQRRPHPRESAVPGTARLLRRDSRRSPACLAARRSDRRRGEEVPGPARIRHAHGRRRHARAAPQRPKYGTRRNRARTPRSRSTDAAIGRVRLNELHTQACFASRRANCWSGSPSRPTAAAADQRGRSRYQAAACAVLRRFCASRRPKRHALRSQGVKRGISKGSVVCAQATHGRRDRRVEARLAAIAT